MSPQAAWAAKPDKASTATPNKKTAPGLAAQSARRVGHAQPTRLALAARGQTAFQAPPRRGLFIGFIALTNALRSFFDSK